MRVLATLTAGFTGFFRVIGKIARATTRATALLAAGAVPAAGLRFPGGGVLLRLSTALIRLPALVRVLAALAACFTGLLGIVSKVTRAAAFGVTFVRHATHR